MLAVFAEFERDILRDRVKAGIDQSSQKGRETAWAAKDRR
jgi:DNA invertase Pin-like site-specific DNA recombinase